MYGKPPFFVGFHGLERVWRSRVVSLGGLGYKFAGWEAAGGTWWPTRGRQNSRGGHQPEATRQVEGNTWFQGGSKIPSYKHSGCKIQASRLQDLKSEDVKVAPVN